MSYRVFQDKVNGFVKKSGEDIPVMFWYDDEIGQFYAYCAGDIVIVGCPSSEKVTVNWGCGHMAMAAV